MQDSDKQLRERFISDINIPLQVYHSPYFEERIEMMNDTYHAKDKWEELVKLINDRFEGSAQLFLDEYHQVRDNIIKCLSKTDAFLKFNADEKINDKFRDLNTFPDKNLYTCEEVKGDAYFLSIDIKKANFSALKHYDSNIVLNSETYEELIYKFTDLSYIANSKYTRQVIFGKLNPKKTLKLESILINQVVNSEIIKYRILPYFDVFSVNCDEIIFKLKKGMVEQFLCINEQLLIDITTVIKHTIGLDVKVEKFKLIAHQFKLSFSDITVKVFEKDNFKVNEPNPWKGLSSIYYPQVYKILNKLEITENDLVFYNNHELAKFIQPLKLITC